MEIKRKSSVKRQAILDALRESEEHPSAEMLYSRLKKDIPDLSLGTVYRNLSMFCEDGSAVPVCRVDGKDRFDGITCPHSHFVCRVCKRVIDVEVSPDLETCFDNIRDLKGFLPESCSVTFSGVCDKCRETL